MHDSREPLASRFRSCGAAIAYDDAGPLGVSVSEIAGASRNRCREVRDSSSVQTRPPQRVMGLRGG